MIACSKSNAPAYIQLDRCRPPFFCAFDALTTDDGKRGLALRLFATSRIEGPVDAVERAVIVRPATRRRVRRERSLPASAGQDVHSPVGHLAQIGYPPAPRPRINSAICAIRRRTDHSDSAFGSRHSGCGCVALDVMAPESGRS